MTATTTVDFWCAKLVESCRTMNFNSPLKNDPSFYAFPVFPSTISGREPIEGKSEHARIRMTK